VAQKPPLPFLLGKTALKLLSSTLPEPAAPAPPSGQVVTLTQHLLTLLRRLLPLLTTREASILLPQSLSTASPNSPASSQEPPSAANHATTVAAGPLTNILLLPLRSGGHHAWPRTSTIPLQSAELLVAACGADDPLDEVLDRLLPVWLPLFRCAPELRSGLGSCGVRTSLDLQRASSSCREATLNSMDGAGTYQGVDVEGETGQRDAGHSCGAAADETQDVHARSEQVSMSASGVAASQARHVGSADSGYWDVVRVLYGHATATLGSVAVRQVVEGWKRLEEELRTRTGWVPDKALATGPSGLSLRQALQISLLKHNRAVPSAVSPAVASTALLMDGVGWSVGRATGAPTRTTFTEHPWPRWLPQTPTAGPPVGNPPQTPLYQPNPSDMLRGVRPPDPPLIPGWHTSPSPLPMFSWPAHKARLSCASVSVCETMLLTAARKDGRVHAAVRSWRLEDFSPGAQYMRHTDVVSSAVFASVSRGIAASTDVSGALHFWRISDAEPIAIISAGAYGPWRGRPSMRWACLRSAGKFSPSVRPSVN
jgi:hypothetical protein